MKTEYEDEKAPSTHRRDSIPLGRTASFKADDYVHADHPVSFTEGKREGEDLVTADDDEEFPPEDHQFTWYVFLFRLSRSVDQQRFS